MYSSKQNVCKKQEPAFCITSIIIAQLGTAG